MDTAPLWEPEWGPPRVFSLLALLALLALPVELGSENMALPTYYSSPLGIYSNMTTTSGADLARDGGRVTIAAGAVAGGTLTVNGNQINVGNISATGNLIAGGAVSAGTQVKVGNTSLQPSLASTPGYAYAGAGTLYSGYAVYTPGNAYVKDVWLSQAGRWASAGGPVSGVLYGYCWSCPGYSCAMSYAPTACSGYSCVCPSGYTLTSLGVWQKACGGGGVLGIYSCRKN